MVLCDTNWSNEAKRCTSSIALSLLLVLGSTLIMTSAIMIHITSMFYTV